MNKAIGMTLWKRPAVAEQALTALANCRGLDGWRLYFGLEAGCDPAVAAMVRRFPAPYFHVVEQTRLSPLGCGPHTMALMDTAFAGDPNLGFYLYLDDDNCLTEDGLSFYDWAAAGAVEAHDVFNVAGQPETPSLRAADVDVAPFRLRQVLRQDRLSVCGFATTRQRWETVIRPACDARPDELRALSWGTFLWREVEKRGLMRELVPRVPVVYNIGRGVDETHCDPVTWYRRHWTPVTADSRRLLRPPGPWTVVTPSAGD